MYYQRLPLETAYNTRDLGGIPTKDGKVVAWKKLLRSDDVCRLNKNDSQFLEDYGVRAVIDLRTTKERETTDYPLQQHSSIASFHIPFVVQESIEDISKSIIDMNLYSFYQQLITEQQAVVKELFTIVHAHIDQGLLFHCAAGKDRTGVFALLLLGLLDVSDADIIANYETSYTYLFASPTFSSFDGYAHLMFSERENMVKLLRFISEKYGTVYDYLVSCGLSENSLKAIKEAYTEIPSLQVAGK